MVKLQTTNNRKSGQAIFAIVSIIVVLLFFVVSTCNYASSLVVKPNELDLKLPSSSPDSIIVSPISVSINQNGIYYIEKEEINKEDLRRKIEQKIQEEKDPERVTIIINTTKETPITDVVEIMDIARLLKVRAILATDAE